MIPAQHYPGPLPSSVRSSMSSTPPQANSAPGPLQACISSGYSIDSHPQPQRLPSPNPFPNPQSSTSPSPGSGRNPRRPDGGKLLPRPPPHPPSPPPAPLPLFQATPIYGSPVHGSSQATKGELYSACSSLTTLTTLTTLTILMTSGQVSDTGYLACMETLRLAAAAPAAATPAGDGDGGGGWVREVGETTS